MTRHHSNNILLTRNLHFDSDQVGEIILELAGQEGGGS